MSNNINKDTVSPFFRNTAFDDLQRALKHKIALERELIETKRQLRKLSHIQSESLKVREVLRVKDNGEVYTSLQIKHVHHTDKGIIIEVYV